MPERKGPKPVKEPRARAPRTRALGAGAAGGLGYAGITALAFAPVGAWYLAPLAMLPLVWAAEAQGSRVLRALGATLGALPFWLGSQAWVRDVSAAGYVPLAVYLSMWAGAFVWTLARVGDAGARPRGDRGGVRGSSAGGGELRNPHTECGWTGGRTPRILAAATIWVGLEVLRGEVAFHGYAWFLLGHPLIEWSGLARPIGATGGAYLMSLWAALIACAAWESVRRRRPSAWLAAPLVVWGGAWLASRTPEHACAALRVGVVQTNVPQSNKIGWSLEQRIADLRRMQALSREAAAEGAEVIVWPETMFPGFMLDSPALEALEAVRSKFPVEARNIRWFADELLATQRSAGVPMLVGAAGQDDVVFAQGPQFDWRVGARYNSVFEVREGRVEPRRYDKRVLTPFGEVMPYVSAWPWLERKLLALGAGGMTFDLAPGTEPVRFEVGGRVIATPVCFEATNAGVVRSHLLGGAGKPGDLIINLTNDGWFGTADSSREHHLLCARWRAVELGVPLVRAANTGISCVIEPDGHVQRAMGVRVDGAEVFGVSGAYRVTPFRAVGNVWTWIPAGGTILLLAGSYCGRRCRADG
ncbi:MAG: apolipoprotein N-acyltransferase [Phycisphaerales bacterium]|nr:apolipoprotein N-acyltransferase [Phycisphaerales bacterium]